MSVFFPYCEKTLTTRVELEPYMMNHELRQNILARLREQKEGCCNRYAFVMHVTSLVDYSSAEIKPEDMRAHPLFDVSYNCVMVTPVTGETVVARVQRLNDSIICCENGPLQIIVQHDFVNRDLFDATGESIVHRMTGSRVEVGTMVRIKILAYKFLKYDTSIKVLGQLEGMATQEESDEGFYDTKQDDGLYSSLLNRMSRLKAKAW